MKQIIKAKKVLKILNEKGFEAFIVGGAVRDYLLKLSFLDIDIITNALPEDLMKIFSIDYHQIHYGSVNIVFQKQNFDITTYRIESEYSNHRHPKKIIFTNDVTKDLGRRDFTINSLLMNDQEQIIDYYEGIIDIKNKLIRSIGDPKTKFQEDSLRIIRAFYFQAKLGFEIEKNTKKGLIFASYLLKYISSDKLLQEFCKLISQKYFLKAFINLKKTNIIDIFLGLKKSILFCIHNAIKTINKEIFFSISFILDNSIFRYFNFTKKDQKLYKTIKFLFNQSHQDLLFILFEYGLHKCLLLNQINYLFKKEYKSSYQIKVIYQNLILKKHSDLKIDFIDILQILPYKPGLWLKRLKNHLIKLILHKKLLNTKNELLNYVKKIGAQIQNDPKFIGE